MLDAIVDSRELLGVRLPPNEAATATTRVHFPLVLPYDHKGCIAPLRLPRPVGVHTSWTLPKPRGVQSTSY